MAWSCFLLLQGCGKAPCSQPHDPAQGPWVREQSQEPEADKCFGSSSRLKVNSGAFDTLQTAEDWGCSLMWGSWLLWLPKHFSAPGVEDGVGDALPWGSCPARSGVGRISGCRSAVSERLDGEIHVKGPGKNSRQSLQMQSLATLCPPLSTAYVCSFLGIQNWGKNETINNAIYPRISHFPGFLVQHAKSPNV